jgi:hypothetical protein
VRETRVGVRDTLRVRGDAPPRLLDRGLEVLELDEMLEIRRHRLKWKSGEVEKWKK